MQDAVLADAASDVARRKERLLQRLQQHRPPRQSGSGVRQAKLREEELEEALELARNQAECGVVDEEAVKTLEGFLLLEECGRSMKQIQETLETLRKATLRLTKEDSSQANFSFSVVKKKSPTAIREKRSPSISRMDSASLALDPESCDTIHLFDLSNDVRTIMGEDGYDVKLKGIKNCHLTFILRPSTVHMQDVRDCKLVFLPVETSVLINNCQRSQIFATAQQLRVHKCQRLRLHIGVRAAVIIESCSEINVAPYRVVFENSMVEPPAGRAWMHIKDFDWLAEGQSPNWCVAPESEWETHVIELPGNAAEL